MGVGGQVKTFLKVDVSLRKFQSKSRMLWVVAELLLFGD
jgi:hypothetical protein